MKELIENFPNQLKESIAIASDVKLTFKSGIENIVICGLGGSGIGGEIIKQWTRSICKLPVEVSHSYEIPAFVNENSLVVTCSYSGNTEETLDALAQSLKTGAEIIGVTSGGKMETILSENNKQVIKVPGGLPPRAALAYPLVQLVEIFEQGEFLSQSIRKDLETSIDLIIENQQDAQIIAKDIIEKSENRKLLFYGEDKLGPVVLRACQQLNENGKVLAFSNLIPEMNHNEIVGWADDSDELYIVFLRSALENPRNTLRLDITESVVSKKAKTHTVKGKGANLVQQTLYLIHVLDWVSLYKAEQKGIDPVEVNIIDYLKSELAK
ncbi:MAG: bifunctional phosphoglucose/phosphomannose isomerase [Crocinitomicaceae bacterium]